MHEHIRERPWRPDRPSRPQQRSRSARRRAMLVPVPEHQLEPVALDVEVVVPVHNEEQALAVSIQRLHSYLSSSMPFAWRIVIADNASTDATPEIAQSLTVALRGVSLLR